MTFTNAKYNEKELLRAILENEYHQGQCPINSFVWVTALQTFLRKTQIRVGLGRLSRKGLIVFDEDKLKVALTRAGFDTANGHEDE